MSVRLPRVSRSSSTRPRGKLNQELGCEDSQWWRVSRSVHYCGPTRRSASCDVTCLRTSLPREQRGQRFVGQFDAGDRITGVLLAGATASGTALAPEAGVVACFAVERIFAEAAE